MSNQTIDKTNLQASNIDQEGNVLYLDEERLERKKIPFKRYQNKRNGLGIYNFLKEHVLYLKKENMKIGSYLYRFFIGKAKWLGNGGIKAKLYKRFIALDPPMEHNTGVVVMPLDVDVTDQSKRVVIPIDMLKESLKNVDFLAGMDECLCRTANHCSNYPQNLGCLFFGEPGRTACKHGLGREITYEEACERIDRAAELGLVAQGIWIEFEQIIWGVRNDQMDDFFEVCFCCPCCCIAMKLPSQMEEKDLYRFHPSGWTAVPDRTKCVGCGKCVNDGIPCHVRAISMGEDGKVVVNQETCVGCGLCRRKCPLDVIQIKQTMPMRENLKEYFDQEFNLDLRVWDKQDGE